MRKKINGHVLYATGDADATEQIKDRNGEVALNCCRVCGEYEAGLDNPCYPQEKRDGEWQPIETAPKDGSRILAWQPSVASPKEAILHWDEWRGLWIEDDGGWL